MDCMGERGKKEVGERGGREDGMGQEGAHRKGGNGEGEGAGGMGEPCGILPFRLLVCLLSQVTRRLLVALWSTKHLA